MAQTVADVLLARLREWNITQVFAFPGDGINGLLAAWGRADNDPQFVQARHEEMAAFEAVGYAKFSGNVGVCAATSGPGAIHLLNGLYDAKLDHVPVVAIVGQTERSAMGGSYQQEVDLLNLFKDVCSDYVQMCTVPEQLPNLIDRAIRIAVSESAPTCIIIPSDVFDLEYVAPGHAFKQVPLHGDRGAVGRAAGSRHPQRRGEGRAAGRAGRPRLRRGADPDRGSARRWRRESPVGEGRPI
jgi:pyruvate dehydrogenase (quinone)